MMATITAELLAAARQEATDHPHLPFTAQACLDLLNHIDTIGLELTMAVTVIQDLATYGNALEGWVQGADHHAGCPGGHPPHPCKCGLSTLHAAANGDT
jgi:hypothetical protein